MKKKVECLLEGHPYPLELLMFLGLSEESISFFESHKVIRKNSSNSYVFDFVGFLYVKNQEFFVCPKYRKEVYSSETVSDFRKIFRFFKTETVSSPSLHLSQDLAEKVLVDFVRNRYFKSESFIEEENWDEVDWEELLSDTEFHQKGHPIVLEARTRTKTIKVDERTKKMQDSFVSYLFTEFPNVFNELSIPLSFVKRQGHTKKEMISYFSSLSSKTKFFREKRMIADYLHLLTMRNESFRFWGTKHFHTLWEKICKYLFNDESDHYKEFFPRPVYTLSEKNKKLKLKGHIPDVVSIPNDESCFVLDAKYYNFDKNLPMTEDVTKQLVYGQICQNLFPKHQIFNAFLFLGEQEESIKKIGSLSYPVFEQEEVLLYSLKDTFVFTLFNERKQLNPQTLPS